jgi:hypothetical protein
MYKHLTEATNAFFSGIFLAELTQKAAYFNLKPDEVLNRLVSDLEAIDAIELKKKCTNELLVFMPVIQQAHALEEGLRRWKEVVDGHAALKPYAEYLFDLFYISWLSWQEDAGNEDWMDSDEWQRMEDKLAERGTEMLNMMMYLQEVRDTGIKANLDDFIEQYLGDDELDFQDDIEVYEEVIANRNWLDLPYHQMVAQAEAMEDDTAIPELFTPLFCFFKSPEKAQINLLATLSAGGNVKRNLPVVLCLLAFYKGLGGIDEQLLLQYDK